MTEPTPTGAAEPALPEPWRKIAYDPLTGIFAWKVACGPVKAGSIAGSRLGRYWSIRLGKKTHLAHRVAVLMMTGAFPPADMTVDHIDGNHLNNAWSNLRVVSQTTNAQNIRKARQGSKSGLIGAHWNEERARWQSAIKVDGRNKYLGIFPTMEEAHAAYVEAKRRFHVGCTI